MCLCVFMALCVCVGEWMNRYVRPQLLKQILPSNTLSWEIIFINYKNLFIKYTKFTDTSFYKLHTHTHTRPYAYK